MSTTTRPYLATDAAASLIRKQDQATRKDLRSEIKDLVAHLERDPALVLHRHLVSMLHNLDGRGLSHLADGVDSLGPWFRELVADAETVTALVMDSDEQARRLDSEPHDPD